MTYVNAYEVTRHYGGPEEGGWWYNTGQPLASVPLNIAIDKDEEIKRLGEIFKDVSEGDIYSVLGGTAVEIYTEDHVARYWPEETPRYE